MPIRSYGVLSGRVVETRREGGTDTPHYQINLVDDAGTAYRVAVNVLSQQSPSELLYLRGRRLRHPVIDDAAARRLRMDPAAARTRQSEPRLHPRQPLRSGGHATAAARCPGPDNDLADLLDHYVHRAQRRSRSRIFVFGERWGPEDRTPDKVFGFLPGNGVHDVHMNQGNSPAFRRDDGVWQDGGLLLHLPAEERWVAIFLAFQSQAWHTDDLTGHTLQASTSTPARPNRPGPDRRRRWSTRSARRRKPRRSP